MSRWLACWGHAPDGVRKVVGDDEGATRVHAHPDRPATSLSVRPSEAGDEVDRRTGGAAATERHKNHFVPDWLAAIPTAMLTDEHAIGEPGTHRRRGEGQAQGGDMRSQAVIRTDRRGRSEEHTSELRSLSRNS